MQCRTPPPGQPTLDQCKARGQAPRKGGWSWGGTTAPGTPAAPTYRDPPIPWSVSNVRTAADHRRSRWWSSWRYITGIEPARQGGRSMVVAGNAAVRRSPKARLRRPAARAAGVAHRVAPPGDHAGKGGRGSPLGLSEPMKCLIVAFALARDTKCCHRYAHTSRPGPAQTRNLAKRCKTVRYPPPCIGSLPEPRRSSGLAPRSPMHPASPGGPARSGSPPPATLRPALRPSTTLQHVAAAAPPR